MANLHNYLHEGMFIDHTPTAIITAGKILQVGSLSVFSPVDHAANIKAAVQVSGVIESPFVGGVACSVGDNIYWDANGTPFGGAADGAMTQDASAGDWWVGTLVEPTLADAVVCRVALNKFNYELPPWSEKTHFVGSIDITMVAATHSGGVIHVDTDAKTITLPVGVVGMDIVCVNDAADAGSLLTVDLNGNEIIEGSNLTIAATKTALLTKTTSARGDYLHLVCNVAATSWRCVGRRGTWVTSA